MSTTFFVDDELLQFFGKKFLRKEFSIKIAPNVPEMKYSGHTATGLKVQGVLSDEFVRVPVALTFNLLTDARDKVANPKMTRKFPTSIILLI